MNTKNFISVIRNTCYFVITKGKIWYTFLLTARATAGLGPFRHAILSDSNRREGQLVLTLLIP